MTNADSKPLVAVVMGSKSDWETMRHAAEILSEFGVPHENRIVSAHRTPAWMAEYASAAEGRGIEIIIAGAGGAAHLPGMVAAHTLLPRLGAPVVSVVTFEFENVPSATAEAAGTHAPVRPSGSILHTTQHRLREKSFLSGAGFPLTPFLPVRSIADLHAGLERLGRPAVLKTAGFGYDGKGQTLIGPDDVAEAAWRSIGGV